MSVLAVSRSTTTLIRRESIYVEKYFAIALRDKYDMEDIVESKRRRLVSRRARGGITRFNFLGC